jgi:HK97 family phage prohead protease
MERIEVKFAADGVSEAGVFAGYGAVFGNVDSHGDVIAPGAFSETLKVWSGRGRLPTMKLMHGTALNMFNGDDLPLGVWTKMHEDDKGLYVEGKISAVQSDFGQRIHGLMKDGALGGLSIGYRVKKAIKGDGVVAPKRTLQEIILGEVSLVDEPSNGLSRVSSVKAADIETVREFEAQLRDVFGYSNAKAKAIASSGFKASDHLDDDDAELAAIIRRNIKSIHS